MRFSRLLSVVCCLIVTGYIPLFAQQREPEPVEVDRVSFNYVRGGAGWLVVNVKVRCNGGTAGARGSRQFANQVRVVLTLAYQGATEREFQFYSTESTALALIAGQTYDFDYYLPHDLLNKRDNIRREPFGYLVELFVEDKPITLNNNSVGKQPTPDSLQSFRDRAAREAGINDGVLIPVYLSPFWSPAVAANAPVYLRKEFR